jgi:hypothetical protein
MFATFSLSPAGPNARTSFVENQESFYLAKTHEDVSFIPEHNSRCIARLDCCIARSLGGMSAGDRYAYSVGGGGNYFSLSNYFLLLLTASPLLILD